MQEPSQSHPPARSRILWRLVLFLCLILVAILGARKISAHDMGFHLTGGEWIAQHRQVPQVDTYTYSAQGNPYIDSHWLYQLALYGLYQAGGYDALTLAHVVLLFCGFLLLALRCRKPRAPDWLNPALLTLAAFIMERRFVERPEIVSWLFLGATLWVLETYSSKRKPILWLLPLLQLVWVDIEGLFVLGWIAMGAYWLGSWREEKKPDPRLTIFSGLAIAADFLNPYFIRGVAYPFSFISKMQGDIYNQTVTELRSLPDFLSPSVLSGDSKSFAYFYCLYLVAYLLVTALTLKRRKWTELLVAVAFGYLSIKAVRNIPLGLIATLPSATAGLSDLIEKIKGGWTGPAMGADRAWRGWLQYGLPVLFALGLTAWGARVATSAYYLADLRPERFGLGLDPDMLPMEAAQYMARERLDGKILNSPNFGGWLEWGGSPPLYMDGRWEVMGDDLYRRYLDMTFTQGRSWGGLSAELIRTEADIVIFEPRVEGSWAEQLSSLSDWRLVYLDGCSALYLKKGYRDDIPDFSWDGMVTSLGLRPLAEGDLEESLGRMGHSRVSYWLDGFIHPRAFPWGIFNRRILLTHYSQGQAALSLDLELARQSGGFYEPFLGWLAQDCLKQGNREGARRVYARIMELRSGDQPGR